MAATLIGLITLSQEVLGQVGFNALTEAATFRAGIDDETPFWLEIGTG